MSQHFLLSPAAKTLSLVKVMRMSEEEARASFRKIRWTETEGEPICPECGCVDRYDLKTRQVYKCKGCGKQFSITSGGRKPGSISKEWQEILRHVYQDGKPLTYEEIAEYANLLGNELQISSVRDRVRNLLRTGLVSGDAESGFVVTKDAVERFSFTKENGEPAGSPETEDKEAGTLFYPHTSTHGQPSQ